MCGHYRGIPAGIWRGHICAKYIGFISQVSHCNETKKYQMTLNKKIQHLLILLAASTSFCLAQEQSSYERAPRNILDVMPPGERIQGEPGAMRIIDRSCREYPLDQVRERIVKISEQEWTFFGQNVIDMTRQEELDRNNGRLRRFWRTNWMDEEQASRLADDVAGYWAAAPDSSWILNKQNQRWNELGITARWRDFWSAAFISWVMCESGLGNPEQFQRAIAHHTYIDQAIRARDGLEPEAAYTAYDIGEQEILPGDMLCRGSRPEYRSLAERRPHMGDGARTHCDVVIEVDAADNLIKVIGGNVRGSVRMKYLPAKQADSGLITPVSYGGRMLFSHLKLNTSSYLAEHEEVAVARDDAATGS